MFSIPCTEENKQKLVRAIDQSENYFCLLNSNQYPDPYSTLNWKISYGDRLLSRNIAEHSFEELRTFLSNSAKPIYGFLGYDLKNDVEKLSSKNTAHISFPELFFFEELVAISEENNELKSSSSLDFDWVEPRNPSTKSNSKIIQHVSKIDYVKNVQRIQEHIIAGDVYELNYCIPFEILDIQIDPVELYFLLNKRSPNPFSGLLKINHQYIISASPERFLCKRGSKIISQPIKGTIKRTENIEKDIEQLLHSEKERAENVMIVDLVRNDLTKTAVTGSIKVEELFGIYSFPQLHQMISTVTSIQDEQYDVTEVIKNAFPMGSMTGAPKVRAMELIEQLEVFKRAAYSGALGYIMPDGTFDFNVLIRSIFIDQQEKKLNFNVGSAITLDSNPEEEYEECLLKAKAIIETLSIGY